MEKYTKPTVNKTKTNSIDCSLKKTACNGANARKFPETSFTKK